MRGVAAHQGNILFGGGDLSDLPRSVRRLLVYDNIGMFSQPNDGLRGQICPDPSRIIINSNGNFTGVRYLEKVLNGVLHRRTTIGWHSHNSPVRTFFCGIRYHVHRFLGCITRTAIEKEHIAVPKFHRF